MSVDRMEALRGLAKLIGLLDPPDDGTPNRQIHPGTHTHKCPNCAHIWEHADPENLTRYPQSTEYNARHRCPKCNTAQTWKHGINAHGWENAQ